MRGFSVGFVILLSLPFAGCSSDPANVDYSPENIVRLNADLVRKAAEAFARENNGNYPTSLRDKSNAGRTLIDLLPHGQRLWNSFRGEHSEPIDWTAVEPGRVAYRPYSTYDVQRNERIVPGYIITGFGASSRIVSIARNYPDSILALEEQVIENCFIVQQAAEAYAAANNGEYATNTDLLTDLLPGGTLLTNPFTLIPTEPVDGTPAANPGETAYEPDWVNGTYSEYEIEGHGECCIIVFLSSRRE